MIELPLFFLAAALLSDASESTEHYGIAAREHARKIHPWVVRLDTATDSLREALDRGDRRTSVQALEDVQFWIGRITCDLISSVEEPGHEALALQVAQAAQRSNTQLQRARQMLGTQYGVVFMPLLAQTAAVMAQPAVHSTVASSVARRAATTTALRRRSHARDAHFRKHGATYGADEEYGAFFLVPLIGAAIGPAAAALAKKHGKDKSARAERQARHKIAVQQRLMRKIAAQQAEEQAAVAKATQTPAPAAPPAPTAPATPVVPAAVASDPVKA